jgi:hypothetical protein
VQKLRNGPSQLKPEREKAMDVELLKALANYGVPALLLFWFIIYSGKIYNRLSDAITRQGDKFDKTLSSTVDRFDKTLEGHESVVGHISQSMARLTEEIVKASTALQT